MPLIVDCSVAVAWFAESQADATTRGAQSRVQGTGGAVPFLFPSEISNALLILERRKKLAKRDVGLAISGLNDLDLRIDQVRMNDAPQVLMPLARRHSLSVYDAAYLELAMRSGLPLATRDSQLIAAAKKEKVSIFAP